MRDRLVELLKDSSQYLKEQDSLIERIADHLLANGVIVPPCKVGDTVYALYDKKVYKTKVFSMVAETEDKKWVYILKCNIFNLISMFKKFLFSKTVFLTKEEAEQALKGGAE